MPMNVNGAAQIGRQLDRLLHRPEDVGRGRHRHEHDADREQALVEIAGPVEAPVERALEHHARRRRREKRQRQGGEERPAQRVDQRHGDVAAEHGEAAVRQVDEVHHPQRHRQPHRQQEQQHPVGEAVEQDAEGRGDHRHAASSRPALVLHPDLHGSDSASHPPISAPARDGPAASPPSALSARTRQ